MSSHHFVTESQSTALYIMGANIFPEVLAQLLEWNPLVITKNSEVERLASENVRIDILMLLQGEEAPMLPYKFQILEGNEDIEELMVSKVACELTIAGPDDDRVPKLLRAYSGKGYTVVVITGDQKHYLIREGRHFQKWMPAGSRFLLDQRPANISGDLNCNERSYITNSAGMVNITAESDILYSEYI